MIRHLAPLGCTAVAVRKKRPACVNEFRVRLQRTFLVVFIANQSYWIERKYAEQRRNWFFAYLRSSGLGLQAIFEAGQSSQILLAFPERQAVYMADCVTIMESILPPVGNRGICWREVARK